MFRLCTTHAAGLAGFAVRAKHVYSCVWMLVGEIVAAMLYSYRVWLVALKAVVYCG